MAKQGGSGKNMKKKGEKKSAQKRKKGVKTPGVQNCHFGYPPFFGDPQKWGYPPLGGPKMHPLQGGVPPLGTLWEGGVPPLFECVTPVSRIFLQAFLHWQPEKIWDHEMQSFSKFRKKKFQLQIAKSSYFFFCNFC